MTFEPFDVVVVPFPFSDRQFAKRLPALVVSSADFNQTHEQSILAMITSTTSTAWASDVTIEQWQAAGLAVSCKVRLKVFTLDNPLIVRRIGKLGRTDEKAVKAALERYFALA